MKTFIRWQGNKSRHINKFKKYLPKDIKGAYIEPFLGSGALFLYLHPEKWIINDLNKDIVNIWKAIQSNPKEIIKEFQKFGKKFLEIDRRDKIDLCRSLTYQIEDMDYNLKRASRYLLMLHCSYASTLIIKNKFYFTSLNPNMIKNSYYFLTEDYNNNLLEVNKYLSNSKGKIYNKSYEEVLRKAKSGDFVFLDPPYIEEHNYHFNYNKKEIFDNTFLAKLLIEVQKLDSKDVQWLMTQSDTKEVRSIFKNYKIHTFPVYRMMKKEYTNELVITNY